MTAQSARALHLPPERPNPSPIVLRRLSAGDDVGGALHLMAGYVDEIRHKLLDGYGL
jgi:hypothetical protein